MLRKSVWVQDTGLELVLNSWPIPIWGWKYFCNLFCSFTLSSGTFQETVFDPVSLSCGHIFCYMCCCSSASVTIIDGLKAADHKAKCPLCRQVHPFPSYQLSCYQNVDNGLKNHMKMCQDGVYENAVHLEELNMMLSRRYPSVTGCSVFDNRNWIFPDCISSPNSCPDYWEMRLQSERVERVRQAKQHWESMSRAFVGI